MNDSMFKVLLYSDPAADQSFSAAVYTAILLKNIPNVHLTILQVQECNDGAMGTEYSWRELKPKYKRYYWGSSVETEYSWRDSWPVRPNSDWMKRVLAESNLETRNQYDRILAKTNEILLKRGLNANHQILCTNINISDKSDTADIIIEYATNNSFNLLIMGTRGLPALKGLISGCLAKRVLNKSPIPVLLIKKLPQEFIDSYLSDTEPVIPSEMITQMTSGQSINAQF